MNAGEMGDFIQFQTARNVAGTSTAAEALNRGADRVEREGDLTLATFPGGVVELAQSRLSAAGDYLALVRFAEPDNLTTTTTHFHPELFGLLATWFAAGYSGDAAGQRLRNYYEETKKDIGTSYLGTVDFAALRANAAATAADGRVRDEEREQARAFLGIYEQKHGESWISNLCTTVRYGTPYYPDGRAIELPAIPAGLFEDVDAEASADQIAISPDDVEATRQALGCSDQEPEAPKVETATLQLSGSELRRLKAFLNSLPETFFQDAYPIPGLGRLVSPSELIGNEQIGHGEAGSAF